MGVTSGPTGQQDDQAARGAALELLKQLITLSAGILAISATFLEKFWTPVRWLQALLGSSWLLLVVALLCSLQAISAMVQSLRRPEFDWSAGATRTFAAAAKWTFVGGISTFAIFAFIAALESGKQPKQEATPCNRAVNVR